MRLARLARLRAGDGGIHARTSLLGVVVEPERLDSHRHQNAAPRQNVRSVAGDPLFPSRSITACRTARPDLRGEGTREARSAKRSAPNGLWKTGSARPRRAVFKFPGSGRVNARPQRGAVVEARIEPESLVSASTVISSIG
jgi:hypothetical protein